MESLEGKIAQKQNLRSYSKDLDAFGQMGQLDERFDASQYAFFGRDVTQEVELGGLDEEDEIEGIEDDETALRERDEIESYELSSDLADVRELASSFAQTTISARPHGHYDGEPIFMSGEVNDHFLESGPSKWMDYPFRDNEPERKLWQQQPPIQKADLDMFKSPYYRQPQQWWGPELPGQSGGPYPPKSHGWQGPPAPTPGSYRAPYHGPQAQVNLPSYGMGMQSGPWMSQAGTGLGGRPGSPSGMVRHPAPQQSTLMPPQVLLQHKRPQNFGTNPPFMQSQPRNVPHQMQPHEPRGRQLPRYNPPSAEANNMSTRRNNDGWPQMRSKYMTVEEVDNIVRIQWAATHGTDPYIDDYYHQAVQAKDAAGTPHGKRHFAPSHLRDLPPHTRTAAEPHTFLQVDALGRIPFSSIRRPRPLLEVDTLPGSNSTPSANELGEKSADSVASQRRLEQEPMLAARIAIEDGLCLLLDVDDIDRYLSSSQPADGGVQLRRRRQMLLEGLAASLQLVDPLAPNNVGGRDPSGRFGFAAKDNLIFLRLVSLPKGRKLVARYLRLLQPGSELVRIVSMAVFRHLRFLFGGAQTDQNATAASNALAKAVSTAAMNMDLPSLSACLAVVVLAPEPPPLRPLGSPSGDGATVILQAVLERATSLLTNRSAQYPVQNRTVWQASFDAFFSLLSKYCTNKYESITRSLMMTSNNIAAVNLAAANAMTREMPIELLRASLPHTNEQQRKHLMEFAQRSIAMGSITSPNVNDNHVNTAAVRG